MKYTHILMVAASMEILNSQVTDALTPQFGVKSGANPSGGESCDGIILNGVQKKISCQCPPPRQAFLAKMQEYVTAGTVLGKIPITFPTGDLLNDKLARIDAATFTLQSFDGKFGIGCPVASTTFLVARNALLPIAPVPIISVPPQSLPDESRASAGNSTAPLILPLSPATSSIAAVAVPISAAPAAIGNNTTLPLAAGDIETVAVPTSAPTTPPAAIGSNTTLPSTGFNPSLVPQFGVKAGINPHNGGGDCDGILVNGVPKSIPCKCPPNQDAFTAKVAEFVQIGNVFGTPATFPSGNSKADQLARINTAIVSLQSFTGVSGVGCPIVSTTFGAQRTAIQALP